MEPSRDTPRLAATGNRSATGHRHSCDEAPSGTGCSLPGRSRLLHRPEHWIFAGTGLKRGDKFGGKDTIVGYECDGCELEWKDGLPFVTHKNGTPESITVLSTCPVRWHPDDCEWCERWEKRREGNAVMGVYTRGGAVFTAGRTDRAHGLRGGDKTVEQIARNILDRLGR
jgi:hypothetical protein